MDNINTADADSSGDSSTHGSANGSGNNKSTTGAYQRRVVDDELTALLVDLPAVSIEGPRAVGKTTTAAQRGAVTFNLDDSSDTLDLVKADIGQLLKGPWPTVIDEWQRLPASWDLIRRAVDADMTAGRFILTGSASPVDTPTHTGAGRIVTVRMRPLSLAERWDSPPFVAPTVSLATLLTGQRPTVTGKSTASLADYISEIVNSGFPGFRHLAARSRRAALTGYIDRIVERDFPEAGRRTRNPASLKRWMIAYAAATSTTASYEKIRDASTSGHGEKPSRKATTPYIETLEQLYILDPIPAWVPSGSRLSRLTESPKHCLTDPALATALLRIGTDTLLQRANPRQLGRVGEVRGALFESLVAQSLRVYAQACEATVGHLREWGGKREVDLIVTGHDGRFVAVEVKLAQRVDDHDVRHLIWLRDETGDECADAVIVTTGKHAYRRPDGIAVVPAALLGP